MLKALFIEPFQAGSHAAFTQWITEGVAADWTVLTLPGRHWKWRMRGSAVWFARAHADALARDYDVLFASSYLPLAELVGLAPALASARKVLYFHENQLAFPVRREHVGGPDYHFGFTQLVSALAADAVVFNSEHNRGTFLDGADALLARMPDAVPTDWVSTIRARSHVLPLPVRFPERAHAVASSAIQAPGEEAAGLAPQHGERGPLILWNHRWEHDKNPSAFFAALETLADEGHAFQVAVCGQQFRKTPAAFAEGREALGGRVVVFGELDRAAYEALLWRADVCVSTANHEFFGVSVLEAMHCGVRPLVPDRLAYPETVPAEFRYADDASLVPALRGLLQRAAAGESLRIEGHVHTAQFAAARVLPRYDELIRALPREVSRHKREG